MPDSFVTQLQCEFDVTAAPVTGNEFHSVCQIWLETFCPNVKQKSGKWVYGGFQWHAYSFKFENALTEILAFEKYQSRPITPFFIFDESNDMLFDCFGESWPDLDSLNDDIYVIPRTMDWTFITTHEMSIGLGPYFAFPPTKLPLAERLIR